MIVSYKWLQSYFKEPLPTPLALADLLTMKVFEVEGMEEKGDDTIFDIKVLPDRAPYCLSHRYIAQEISGIVRQEISVPDMLPVPNTKTKRKISISVEEKDLCIRYMGRVVENISIGPSPEWLKTCLLSVGQRSINNIVDYTNLVMLEIGQPMHAFDADKVVGNISVRLAKEGEELVILDGTSLKLSSSMLVIADENGPLALAGVKGGKRAEISESTKNIILEAATFKGSSVRRTSQTVGIRNDSSKRFENEVTAERAQLAMDMISDLIAKDTSSKAEFGETIDVYHSPIKELKFDISIKKINAILGCEIPGDTIADILKWCKIGVEKKGDDLLSLSIPPYRSDLRIQEDIADEIGRLYGYENVPVRIPKPEFEQGLNKNFYYINLIKKLLMDKGFSEVYTYTLKNEGDMVLENPLNAERGNLRNDLASTFKDKLEFNLRNMDLLGQTSIKIFEMGKVFGKKREHWSLAVGIAKPKNTKGDSVNEEVRNIREYLIASLGASIKTLCTVDDTGGLIVLNNKQIGEINRVDGVMELDIEKIIEALPEVTPEMSQTLALPPLSATTYRKISPYPFMVRDIAVFIPGEEGHENEAIDMIKRNGTDLLVRVDLFDTFTKRKEGEPVRTSYAFRMIYQAVDRTLVDEEINSIMQKITDDMNSREDWQVR